MAPDRPTHRRKVTAQMPIGTSSSASTSQASSSSPATTGAPPRLKARVNPAGIVSPINGVVDHTPPPPRPALGRTPSNVSLRPDGSPAPRANSSPVVPSSSRSAVGVGSRPPVARAQSSRSGTAGTAAIYHSPTASSVVSGVGSTTPVSATGARVRPSSVVGGASSSSTPPVGRSLSIDSGSSSTSTSTGSRFRAAVAGIAGDDTTPTRVHVRSNSLQQGDGQQQPLRHARAPSISSDIRPNPPRHTSAPSETTIAVPQRRLSVSSETSTRGVRKLSGGSGDSTPPALMRKISQDSAFNNVTTRRGSAEPPRPVRQQQPTHETSPRGIAATTTSVPASAAGSSSPRLPGTADHSRTVSRRPSHLSSLAEVTPASVNLTVHPQGASPSSSSLLSPSTLVPQVLAPEHTATPTHDITDSALDASPEREPSSNHSSPVLQPRPLGSHSPVFHHHLQFGHVFGPPATASAPTSPVPHGLGLDHTSADRKQRRTRLPWNPNSNHAAPSLGPVPSSPELRTVALPMMTPTRSYDSTEGHSSPSGLGLHQHPLSPRRMSSGSEGSGTDTPARLMLLHSRTGASRGRLSGSTIADDSDEKLEAVVSSDVERAERAKVERKIADLEISNASLLAINRTLEASKAKQRGEIMRLRRALRENRAGLGPVSAGPGVALTPASADEHEEEEDDLDMAELEDPELEARWERLADLVGAMRRRGDEAIDREREAPRIGVQRVLGWLEVEGIEGEGITSNGVSSAASEDAGGDGSPPDAEVAA